jgi:hypothetical protein
MMINTRLDMAALEQDAGRAPASNDSSTNDNRSAAAIAELVTSKKPVRAGALKCVRQGGIASPVRIIERARTALDGGPGGRRGARFGPLRTSGEMTRRRSSFDPPAGFRYAAIQLFVDSARLEQA